MFSLSDLAVLTDENKASLSVQLTRLVNAGIITHAAREWYENPFNSPSAEEVAMVLRNPSYLSLEYALSKHGILSQRVYTLTLVTVKFPYTYRTDQREYEYHQINRSLFWGYQKEGMVLTAESEKALLDLIYIRCVHTKEMDIDALFSLVDDMDVGELNLETLSKYAKSFDNRTRRVFAKVDKLK